MRNSLQRPPTASLSPQLASRPGSLTTQSVQPVDKLQPLAQIKEFKVLQPHAAGFWCIRIANAVVASLLFAMQKLGTTSKLNLFRLQLAKTAGLLVIGHLLIGSVFATEIKLLNVSYDVTREFYQDYNAAFVAHWTARTGDSLTVNQSHGGSSKQARSVLDGLEADVVTMNNFLDLDVLHQKANLIPSNWASRLPNNSTPYFSTILFIVRKGNPKDIRDWEDLVRPGVASIVPNPKTSGNGRYSYLAAYGYALKSNGGDEAKARAFVGKLFNSVPVLDTGGRGATTTFAQRGLGDVLLTFENEVQLTLKEFGADKFNAVVPSVSILAENPVVWVDKVVNKRGTAKVAQAYLEYLFSDAGQELAAKHHFRPQNSAILAKHRDRFKPIQLFTVAEVFGGWANAQKFHFSDGGQFDQIYQKSK